MEVFKRLSAGRLSESAGPIAAPELDRLLRTLNLNKSAELSLSQLNEHERMWLEQFVSGINYYIENMKEPPTEFGVLNYKAEKWTAVDALRVGRLGASDANWASLFRFLQLRKNKNWQQVWRQYTDAGKNSVTSFSGEQSLSLNTLVSSFSRVGSNSVVVSGAKTKHGSALIASDPHLGIFVPNLWLLMGYKTPTYHVIGYMLPGVPAVPLGRNMDVAWGGTYMRGISSHLIEEDPSQEFKAREETIGRRFWFDKVVTIREGKNGPILTDIDQFSTADKPIALSWTGHKPSNEYGAYLERVRSFAAFSL